jgi:hypothetical protein
MLMQRRVFVRDDGVTEVIGYVLSFALSAIFLLLALNVFWAARENTEEVTTGVELKTLSDRIAARVTEMGSLSQEFPNATLNITIRIPQSLNGRLYTLTATKTNVTAATDDGALSATSTTFKIDVLEDIAVLGSVGSSNEQVRIQYDKLVNNSRQIMISGE